MDKRFLTITLMAVIVCLSAVTVQAAKNIAVEFEYSQPAESFNLYMNGAIVCTDVTMGTMTCSDVVIDYGMHQFTMTAVSGGIETLHSPAYMWAYNPVQGPGPTIINFNVTVEDGTIVPLGAIKVN